MSRHLADKRAPSDGGRVKHFLRIAREGGEQVWRGLWQKPRLKPAEGRRVVEYARIERGRST
ncbi:MAG: hypothetical protein KF887_01755 [Paracoccaceae bacterium]|nr:MAG: hypothetical protein KF887_01755 [Paracoccaceae bacterium]